MSEIEQNASELRPLHPSPVVGRQSVFADPDQPTDRGPVLQMRDTQASELWQRFFGLKVDTGQSSLLPPPSLLVPIGNIRSHPR